MKVYQLQVVNLEDVEYALRVAAKVIAYGFRVDLKPMAMNSPQSLIMNTWCDSDDSYAGLVKQLFLEIADYNAHTYTEAEVIEMMYAAWNIALLGKSVGTVTLTEFIHAMRRTMAIVGKK